MRLISICLVLFSIFTIFSLWSLSSNNVNAEESFILTANGVPNLSLGEDGEIF